MHDNNKVEKILGRGSYGKVVEYDYIDSSNVKIKAAAKIVVQSGYVSGISNYTEIGILQNLGRSSNFVVKLLETKIFSYVEIDENEDEKKIDESLFYEREEYLKPIFELAYCDGLTFFKSETYTFDEYKLMCSQILLGLEYIHRQGICHRDLKSANLLVFLKNGRITLKIADFGLAIYLPYKGERDYEVQTVTYRSPEIMFGVNNYEITCDIWSAGVIFVEMFIGKTWFSEIGRTTTKSEYIDLCIDKICDELTPEVQKWYREFSGDLTTQIKGKTSLQKIEQKSNNYINFLRNKSKFRKLSDDKYESLSSLLCQTLKFNYFTRKKAKTLLEHRFFNDNLDYITEKKNEQYVKRTFEVVNFSLSDEQNLLKLEYFLEALDILDKIYIRHFFYALDISNRFLSGTSSFEVKDICACALYFVHKSLAFTKKLKNPEAFFFHIFSGENISIRERYLLDKKIYEIETEILDERRQLGAILRPTFYDMQNCYKNDLKEHEKHDLSKSQITILFKELCKEKEIRGKSYRKIYREYYKKYIDNSFLD